MGAYFDSVPRQGGKAWTLLGFLAAGGLAYLTYAYVSPTTTTEVAVAGGSILFLGGFLARRGKSGALVGFLVAFLPLLVAGVVLLGAGLLPQAEAASQSLAGIVESFAQELGIALAVILGLLLIIAAFVFGAAGAVIGGIGGWIGSKVFSLGGEGYTAPEPYYDAEYPPPPPDWEGED